jgi:hypothetical protein
MLTRLLITVSHTLETWSVSLISHHLSSDYYAVFPSIILGESSCYICSLLTKLRLSRLFPLIVEKWPHIYMLLWNARQWSFGRIITFFLFIWTCHCSSLFIIPSVGYKAKSQKMVQSRHNPLYIRYLTLLQLADMMFQLDSHGIQVKPTAATFRASIRYIQILLKDGRIKWAYCFVNSFMRSICTFFLERPIYLCI